MKTFKLKIELENDAFAEYPILEIADMLEKLSQKMREDCTTNNYAFYRDLRDVNGNVVGKYAIKEE